MNFQILRMQKLKSKVSVLRSFKHSFREQDTPNADSQKLDENSHFGADSANDAMQNFKDRLPEKVRKNGVLAVEFLVTASPEAMAEKSTAAQDEYFKDALEWIKQKHGSENVVYAGIHRDETTPHMYAYVVPIDEKGKLNCRHFYGERNALSQMQDKFNEKVGQKHDLDRGQKGSKARHTRVKEYYANLKKAEKGIELTPEECKPQPVDKKFGLTLTKENETAVAQRLNEKIKPLTDLANALDFKNRKLREAENSRDKFAQVNKKLKEKVRGISDADIATLKVLKRVEREQKKASKKDKEKGFSR